MTAPVSAGGRGDLVFPDGFVWGVGCSAHQVEGGSDDSWSSWEVTGRVAQSAGDACGWWTDAERDFDHARTMGLNALRLSTAWSRIEPEPGRFDDTALARYSEMVDGLVDRGIEPWVCLHHFANPNWFETSGGFLRDDAPARFAAYTARVVDALGDRVTRWLTFNEPNVYIVQGYLNGAYPPGRNARFVAATRLLGSMARCHAAAYETIHHRVADAEVSWAQHQIIFDPANPARRADRAVAALQRRSFNEAFSDTIIHGRAPQALGRLTGDLPPRRARSTTWASTSTAAGRSPSTRGRSTRASDGARSPRVSRPATAASRRCTASATPKVSPASPAN